MNIEIGNAISGYVETLYNLNQRIIKLCGTDVIEKYEFSHKSILDIIQDIPRLIPYSYNRRTQRLELNDDGLMEYKNELSYIKEKYDIILNDNYRFLDDIRIIRNKYEHIMHHIKRNSSGSGLTTFFDFEFIIEGKIITIYAVDFIKLIKELNSLFSLIVKDLRQFVYNNEIEDNMYYRRLFRFDFNEFNMVFESELLRIFGKIMIDY